MAKDTKKKDKLPPILKGPVSPLSIRRDYDGDQNEIKADMLKEIDLNNPPPVPPLVKKIPIDKPIDYDTGAECPCQQCQDQAVSPVLEETCGEDGATVSITVCPTSKSAGSRDVQSLVDRIRGLIKLGQVISWDICSDINSSLDEIVKKSKERKNNNTED